MSETYIIDNLKKFGTEFQTKCISALVSDKSFIERISDILEPQSFETDAHQFIVKETVSYFLQYKELPTLAVFKVKVDSIDNELLKKTVVDQLRLVYQKITDSDLKFIKEQFLEFCKNQKLKNAIMESVDHLKNGQYDKIKHVVDVAMKAGMERNIGHEYEVDVEKRMSMMARKTVKTNWTEVDTVMDGGLAGPIKTVSAHSLKLHAERIQTLGTKVDMIIVDYADILRPSQSERNSNSYSEAGGIYEELRGIAGELQVPVWTASQSNRAAMDEDIIQANNISDSYRKIMTADFVMSLSRKVNDKVSNTARFHIIKNRFGPDGITFPSRMNAGCGDIQIFAENSREGMGIINEMNQGENLVKKMMSGKWNAHMSEEDSE